MHQVELLRPAHLRLLLPLLCYAQDQMTTSNNAFERPGCRTAGARPARHLFCAVRALDAPQSAAQRER